MALGLKWESEGNGTQGLVLFYIFWIVTIVSVFFFFFFFFYLAFGSQRAWANSSLLDSVWIRTLSSARSFYLHAFTRNKALYESTNNSLDFSSLFTGLTDDLLPICETTVSISSTKPHPTQHTHLLLFLSIILPNPSLNLRHLLINNRLHTRIHNPIVQDQIRAVESTGDNIDRCIWARGQWTAGPEVGGDA